MKNEIIVNGNKYQVNIDPETPLLWYLRDTLGLMGTKYSCGEGECGACTVHVNGEPVLSCVTSVAEVFDKKITTIEGLSGEVAEALFETWVNEDVPQCGYCQPGQLMTASAFLEKNKKPTDEEIKEALSGVLCRCGTYQTVRKAVKAASKRLK